MLLECSHYVSAFMPLNWKTVVVEPEDHESHAKASHAVYNCLSHAQ